jgi:hypothetical protein
MPGDRYLAMRQGYDLSHWRPAHRYTEALTSLYASEYTADIIAKISGRDIWHGGLSQFRYKNRPFPMPRYSSGPSVGSRQATAQ